LSRGPGVHTGAVYVVSGLIKKKLTLIIEVESKKVLFDLTLNIPSLYKGRDAGDEVLAQVTLFNLEEIGLTDVKLTYQIKSLLEGTVLVEDEETVTVGTQASFEKRFTLPDDTIPADYVLNIHTKYGDSFGTASDTFKVIAARVKLDRPLLSKIGKAFSFGAEGDGGGLIAIVVIVVLGLVFLFLLYEHKLIKKIPKLHIKKTKRTRRSPHRKRKLEKQLAILERIRDSGLVRDSSYKKDKARIKRALGRSGKSSKK